MPFAKKLCTMPPYGVVALFSDCEQVKVDDDKEKGNLMYHLE